ncbi:hypothetical protein JYT28_00495 [Desulfobulbus sp. AH-315-M07]|nr:hypothetical protein [Desulfobulbus sp. AH-315-M07]
MSKRWWVVGVCVAVGCSAADKSASTSGATDDGATSGNGGSGGGATSASGGSAEPFTGSGGAGGGTGGACSVAAQQQPDATCIIDVQVDNFSVSMDTCFVDSPLVNGDLGVLSFMCGDGAATLTFPAYEFVGNVTNCVLDLALKTQFQFTDGCTWESTQAIAGPLEAQVTYTYTEAPIVGTFCATPCTVNGVMSLEQAGPVVVAPPK